MSVSCVRKLPQRKGKLDDNGLETITKQLSHVSTSTASFACYLAQHWLFRLKKTPKILVFLGYTTVTLHLFRKVILLYISIYYSTTDVS